MEKNLSKDFPIGNPNDAYAQYFIGQSYLAPLTLEQIPAFNVTFEPGCRNNWHIHHADEGGGQMLICIAGKGWYQEWGKAPRALRAGDVVNIPANYKYNRKQIFKNHNNKKPTVHEQTGRFFILQAK